MIQLLLTFIVFAFAANGLGNLYMLLIRHGQLLDFMQTPLQYLHDKKGPLAVFIYKSIGGCDTCTIQRFADVTFFVMVYINPGYMHSNPILNFLIWFFIYCLFGGMVFYASALTAKNEPKQPAKTFDLNNLKSDK